VQVKLEDDLRGRVERFDIKKHESPKRREHGSDSKDRQQ